MLIFKVSCIYGDLMEFGFDRSPKIDEDQDTFVCLRMHILFDKFAFAGVMFCKCNNILLH